MNPQVPFARAIVRCFSAFILGLILAAALPARAAQFQSDGTIVGGTARIALGPDGLIVLSNDQGDRYDIHLSMGIPSKPWFNGAALEHKTFQVDVANKKATFRGDITPPGAEPVSVEFSLAMTPAGRALVNLRFDKTSLGNVHIHTSRSRAEGHVVQIDDVTRLISPGQTQRGLLWEGKPREVIYFPDDLARRIVFHPIQSGRVYLKDQNTTARNPYVELGFPPEGNKVEFEVDLGTAAAMSASDETYTGVDFYAADKLKMPRYSLTRNLIQNPSFEEGLRHWRLASLGVLTDVKLGEHYSIDENEAQCGRRSLKILAEAGQSPTFISTFGIPLKTGAQYTLSFYAKADKPGLVLGTQHVSAAWGTFPGYRAYPLTTQWKRYSVTFTAPNGLLSPGFGLHNPPTNGVVWLDAMQLEEGPMTDYVEQPAGARLVTAHRDNLFAPDEKVQGCVEIHAPANAKGEVELSLTDFFDHVIHKEKREFVADERGLVSLQVLWTTGLPNGLYVLEMNLKLADGFATREFDRLAVMPSLAGVARKNDFMAILGQPRHDNWPRAFDRWQHLGVNRMINFDPPPHAFLAEAKKHGFLNLTSIFEAGEKSGTKHVHKDFHCTPDELKMIEENAYKRASEYPEIGDWKLINEPNMGPWDKSEELKKFIEPLAAARRGLLRANPKARVISPDPANMYTQAIRAFSRFLDAGGGEVCDIMAIHPYRPRPEEPDLDADLASMISMLDQHKYKGELWLTEGIYHQNYMLPAYGLDVHKGCSSDQNRTGAFSYHMGWGERMCAAYTARSFIIALKYADRVKMDVDWGLGNNVSMDVDLLTTASAFVPNTIGRLLGNADYRSDVVLGEGVRGYMFEDQQQRPVAVLWTTTIDIDSGRKEGPQLDLSHLPRDVEVIDLLGKTVAKEELKQYRLSPFPLFLRGQSKTLATLTQAMTRIELSAKDVNPIRVELRALSATQVEVIVHNRLTRPAEGQLRVSLNDKQQFDQAVTIPIKQAWKQTVTLPTGNQPIRSATFTTEFIPRGSSERASSKDSLEILTCPYTPKPITLDGDLADWPAKAAIALPARFMEFDPLSMEIWQKYPNGAPWKGAADLSATLYRAWDEEFFYLAISVRDDVFHPAPTLESSWTGDGVQLYFDSWADARTHTTKGYDNNDQVYDVWPGPDGVQVRRAAAPEQQLAFLKTGLVPEVRSAFKRTADGYVIELAFPIRQLAPIQFKAGSSFGFALILNDHDGDYRKRGLTLTPSGTEPHMRPDLYPVMILEK